MKIFSFRVKIIWTIVIVVSLFSVISFTVFNIFLRDKLISQTEEVYNQMNLLRDQYYFTISQHDGRIIKSMLQILENDKDVLKTYLVNSQSKVVYPNAYASLKGDTNMFRKLYSQPKDISIKAYHKEPVPFYRVFIRLENSQRCYSCHNPSQKHLGLIIMDLSSDETQGIITLTKQFSFYYTILILLSIFILVAYLHYKYIRKSLKQFKSTIAMVNNGKLETRLVIPEVRELGKLGKDFNEMLATFDRTQKELQVYHQKELQNSQKLATIGEMSARIAHEIRNPLTGISRALEVIVSEAQDSGNKPILEEIQRQANRVNQAISNLLKYSRSKDLVLESGSINGLIQSLVFFLRNQAHEKSITFEMNLQESIPEIQFDHELIENVLLNLSFNAIEACKETGEIHFTSQYQDQSHKILISVADNGIGIPPEVGSEIFKPFYTTRTKGTGLGLAITKDIIDKHNGEIWYENGENGGCTFFILLPA
ncbi:MAG: GHKL domain-containing protein [Bacteroidetes bacterium]|nr:GHKL domain-containing protein [Bacteroidota bacterium]